MLNPAKGLIQQKVSLQHFDLIRFEPSEDLKAFIENYWVIRWDLTNKPSYTQTNLPHPSQHMVIDPNGQSGIFGLTSGKFEYKLQDKGCIFGIKFWPGAFRLFYPNPVSQLTDNHIPWSKVFPVDELELEQQLLQADDINIMATQTESLLRKKIPKLNNRAILARLAVEAIEKNKNLALVSDVAANLNLSTRSLQRLFDDYIGINPQWVIERYRMLDALEALNSGQNISLTDLALNLGYFDQAHFSNKFTALVGVAPSHYNFSK